MIKHNHLYNNIGTDCYNHWWGVSLNNLWNQSCQFKCKHVRKWSISCPLETVLNLAVSLTSEQPLGTVASHHPPPSPSSLCTMVLPNLTSPVTAPSMPCCVPLPLHGVLWHDIFPRVLFLKTYTFVTQGFQKYGWGTPSYRSTRRLCIFYQKKLD